jgi:hypothetical protein
VRRLSGLWGRSQAHCVRFRVQFGLCGVDQKSTIFGHSSCTPQPPVAPLLLAQTARPPTAPSAPMTPATPVRNALPAATSPATAPACLARGAAPAAHRQPTAPSVRASGTCPMAPAVSKGAWAHIRRRGRAVRGGSGGRGRDAAGRGDEEMERGEGMGAAGRRRQRGAGHVGTALSLAGPVPPPMDAPLPPHLATRTCRGAACPVALSFPPPLGRHAVLRAQ